MGNLIRMSGTANTYASEAEMDVDDSNGLYLCNYYIPEEVLTVILSHVPPTELLKLTLVCKNWNQLIKDNIVWLEIYKRKYPKKKVKLLPWHVYHVLFTTNFFDTNLIQNGNGEKKFKHWNMTRNFGDGFRVEKVPCGSPALPLQVEEFRGETGCFATSFYECTKHQEIRLDTRPVYLDILRNYKPTILVSEWICARFDCGCTYKMRVLFEGEKSEPREYEENRSFEQWADVQWQKVEMIVDDYPEDLRRIIFEHEGKDRHFWKGHYGSKMAGAVVKVLFDSIKLN